MFLIGPKKSGLIRKKKKAPSQKDDFGIHIMKEISLV